MFTVQYLSSSITYIHSIFRGYKKKKTNQKSREILNGPINKLQPN